MLENNAFLSKGRDASFQPHSEVCLRGPGQSENFGRQGETELSASHPSSCSCLSLSSGSFSGWNNSEGWLQLADVPYNAPQRSFRFYKFRRIEQADWSFAESDTRPQFVATAGNEELLGLNRSRPGLSCEPTHHLPGHNVLAHVNLNTRALWSRRLYKLLSFPNNKASSRVNNAILCHDHMINTVNTRRWRSLA